MFTNLFNFYHTYSTELNIILAGVLFAIVWHTQLLDGVCNLILTTIGIL